MRLIIISGLLLLSFSSFAQKKKKAKVIYKYKKYEKFDFDDLSIQGEAGTPGDLSVTPRYQKKFQNKLPLRKSFVPEIRKSIERVR